MTKHFNKWRIVRYRLATAIRPFQLAVREAVFYLYQCINREHKEGVKRYGFSTTKESPSFSLHFQPEVIVFSEN